MKFSRRSREKMAKKCAKKVGCTCKDVILLIKLFCVSDVLSLPSMSSDLVQLGHSQTSMLTETVFVIQEAENR